MKIQKSFVVATMLATDSDEGYAGVFSWSIVDGNSANGVTIDANTGIVRVTNPAAFDFESEAVVSVTFRATDRGIPCNLRIAY